MPKAPLASRADLLRALAAKAPANPVEAAELALALGYGVQAQPQTEHIAKDDVEVTVSSTQGAVSPPKDASTQFQPWQNPVFLAATACTDEAHVTTEPDLTQGAAIQWQQRPAGPTTVPWLLSQQQLAQRLQAMGQAAANHWQASQWPDWDAACQQLARLQPLPQPLPRQQRKGALKHVHILLDRSQHLVPLWADQQYMCLQLRLLLPGVKLHIARLDELTHWPERIAVDGQLSRWSIPRHGWVLALSDLGTLAEGGARQAWWARLGVQLRQQGCHCTVLSPDDEHRLPQRLQRYWQYHSAQGPVSTATDKQRLYQVQQLLSAVAPCVRLEPMLLRALRKALLGPRSSVAVECLLWQHAAIGSQGHLGATLHGQAKTHWGQALAEQSAEFQQQTLATIRHWRAHAPAEIWFEELLSLLPQQQQYLPAPQDIEDAEQWLLRFSQRGRGFGGQNHSAELALSDAEQAWFRRFYQRYQQRPPAQRAADYAANAIDAVLNPRASGQRYAASFRAGHAPPTRRYVVDCYQRGGQLLLCGPNSVEANEQSPRSPLGRLHASTEVITLQHGQQCDHIAITGMANTAIQPVKWPLPALQAGQAFTLASNLQTLTIQALQGRATATSQPQTMPDESATDVPLYCPWAEAIGRDQYGLWAECRVKNISFILRWMPAGRARLGSPENELGRQDWELAPQDYTLQQGYWLMATPVTQALWQSLMANNPSRFQSPQRPVEQVNVQEDVPTFTQRLIAELAPPGWQWVLPTEQQWEYACRAGTTSATWLGELDIKGENKAPILDDIAWYGGNSGQGFELDNGYDSSNWPDKHYPHQRAGTRPVMQKHANPWGLYDLLGNVWEWTATELTQQDEDIWAKATGKKAGDKAQNPERVLRGGSWSNGARYLRAAYRFGDRPGSRNVSLGFRLALVPLSSSEAEPKGAERSHSTASWVDKEKE